MLEYQTRVITEQVVLKEKATSLYNFFVLKDFDSLDRLEQRLLKQQYYAMMVYLSILEQRIERF